MEAQYVASDTRKPKRTHHYICEDLVIVHLNVSDGDSQAEHLLQLELDGRAHLDKFVVQVLAV